MYLVRLVYASRISNCYSPDDIEDILKIAKANNHETGVTGILCFSRKYFLQCLEGGRQAVNKTYHQILNDPRHEQIVLLDYRQIDQREFSRWGMAYVPEQAMTDDINLLFSRSRDFDPYSISGEGAHKMMLKLSETLPTI